MQPTINVSIKIVPFGTVTYEVGKAIPQQASAEAVPSSSQVYYSDAFQTDSWVYEIQYQAPTPQYIVPQTTLQTAVS